MCDMLQLVAFKAEKYQPRVYTDKTDQEGDSSVAFVYSRKMAFS